MERSKRPDLREVRKKLAVLITVIALAVAGLLVLTFYLYGRFTRGIQLAP